MTSWALCDLLMRVIPPILVPLPDVVIGGIFTFILVDEVRWWRRATRRR